MVYRDLFRRIGFRRIGPRTGTSEAVLEGEEELLCEGKEEGEMGWYDLNLCFAACPFLSLGGSTCCALYV